MSFATGQSHYHMRMNLLCIEESMMDFDSVIELSKVTVEDCEDLFNMKGVISIIHDGQIIGFTEDTL